MMVRSGDAIVMIVIQVAEGVTWWEGSGCDCSKCHPGMTGKRVGVTAVTVIQVVQGVTWWAEECVSLH